jgi:hypothetical protein
MIKTQKYVIEQTTTLTKDSLTQFISKFWNEIFSSMANKDNIHLLLLVKVQFNTGDMRTLSDMRAVNFIDQDLFTNFLIARLGILADNYKDTPFSEIIFTYVVKDGVADDERALLSEQEYHVFQYSYNNMQIPLTNKPSEYGKIVMQYDDGGKTKYGITSDDRTYFIESDGVSNEVHIPKPIDLKWTDTKLSDTMFKREIMKDTLYVKDGQIILKEKQLNAKPFKVEKLDTELDNNSSFMTIDIETVLIDNKQVPYLICGYSNNQYIHSFATDLTDDAIKTMFNKFISQLLSPKFKDVKYIYAHNFSGFDGILLLEHLLNFDNFNVKPLLFNNKLISIKFSSSKNRSMKQFTRTLVFKDSFLLLPMALRKLCKAFKVDTMKTNFPFNLTDINYVGEFPSFDLWTDLTQEQYNLLKANHGDKVWSFKEESIKYCKIDCEALYEVL